MSISKTEKILIALGFVPVVSTVVGVIKAFAYYKNAYTPAKERIEVNRALLQETGKTIDELAKIRFRLNTQANDKSALKQLIISSIFQAIPGINIIASLAILPAYRNHVKAAEAYESTLEANFELPVDLNRRYSVRVQSEVLDQTLKLIYVHLDDNRIGAYHQGLDKGHIAPVIAELALNCEKKRQGNPNEDPTQIFIEALEELLAARKALLADEKDKATRQATFHPVENDEVLGFNWYERRFLAIDQRLQVALNRVKTELN